MSEQVSSQWAPDIPRHCLASFRELPHYLAMCSSSSARSRSNSAFVSRRSRTKCMMSDSADPAKTVSTSRVNALRPGFFAADERAKTKRPSVFGVGDASLVLENREDRRDRVMTRRFAQLGANFGHRRWAVLPEHGHDVELSFGERDRHAPLRNSSDRVRCQPHHVKSSR